VDIEEKVQSALAVIQSAHLVKRASPAMMSNPSIVRPAGSSYESYHFSDEDNTRKSLVSRVDASSVDAGSALKQTKPEAKTGQNFNALRASVDSARVGSADSKFNSRLGSSVEEGDINVQYGPKTMEILYNAVSRSYKLFWDGEISTYVDTAHSSENNKLFLQHLLEMRINTD